MKLKLNLPTVPVDAIAIHPRDNDLVFATHGSSIWIFDDLTPIEQMPDAVAAEELHLFDLRPATEWRIANRSGATGQKAFFGPNPPNGALIDYYLKTKPDEKERVRITVLDKDGKVVRELDGTKDVGVNRVVWDLRTRSVTAPPPRETGSRGQAGETAAGTAAGAAPSTAAAATAAAGESSSEAGETGEQPAAAGGGGFGGFRGGLRVEPGEYTIKVAV